MAEAKAAKGRPAAASSGAPGLVVVSNRLPYTTERSGGRMRFRRSPGGLVSALEPVLRDRGGVWVGWPGVEVEDAASAAELTPPDESSGRVRYEPVPLSRREVAQYYGGFSNRTLWPLFHYFIPYTQFDNATWRVYERVNERFAEAAIANSSPDSLVWVHDYQLMRTARYLRRLRPDGRFAFFLHIPFPSYEVFRILPWARSLMRGMLGCDLVGFQVRGYVEHFLDCAEKLLGCVVDYERGTVGFEDRQVTVEAHPIGIDVAHFEELARNAEPAAPGEAIEILGLDRLDYTKGIPERLLAIERLLERYPEYRRKIVFIQLAVPSRTGVEEYQALKREVDELVGRINGRFSEPGWTPINYLVRSVPQTQLVSLYRRAKVALLTPLRDGMNLVAKEYVASQIDNDGVLILSAMAGAAEDLKEALIVNPYDIDAVADMVHQALSMTDSERRARMSALRDRVRAGDVRVWVDRFLASAEAASARARAMRVSRTAAVRRALQPWLRGRPTVALFLDYDGTLTPIAERPERARLRPAVRRALRDAVHAHGLDVVIVSGRALDDVRRMVRVDGLTYVGNHGFEIEGPGITFRHGDLERYQKEVDQAAAELEAADLEGAWVERKGATLTVHTRKVPDHREGAVQAQVEAILRRHGLRVTRGKRAVEGRPPIRWNKGYAVLHVLSTRYGDGWASRVRAVYIGDDVTDEDAFRSLRGIGRSIRVGPSTSETAADYALPDPEAVLELLRWFASGAFQTPEEG